ncbi:Eco57I restriction-modification methylase domain-containing protein [Halomonas sp. AOP42-D2-25]
MVSFLLDNSLGAWWAARQLSESDLKHAESEEELRQKASIPGVPLDYLRFVKQEDGAWTPAAGTFDAWPEQLADLKTLDPCCGSGHFLVAAFLMLVPMRMERDGLSARDAVDAVLRENIHGLELDQRCVELAAFALALTAWKYPGAEGYRPLPELQLACSGLSISAKKEEWLALAGDNTDLRVALEELYRQFRDAPILGSLINPEASLSKGSLFELTWEEVGPLLSQALAEEKDEEKSEIGVIARGVSKSSSLLSRKFELIITNVPYLGIRKQNDFLKKHLENNYKISKGDLATVFLEKFLKNNVKDNGLYAVVTPSAFANKDYFKELRKEVLQNYVLSSLAFLGPRAFETITGEVVDVSLLSIEKTNPKQESCFCLIDVFEKKNHEEKSNSLKSSEALVLQQRDQLSNPDCRIQPNSYGDEKLLLDYCECPQGIKTGDDEKWIKKFWERPALGSWNFCQSSSNGSQEFGGLDKIIDWSTHGIGMTRPRLDSIAVGKWAVGLSQTGQKRPVRFIGARFDSNLAPVLPKDSSHLLPIWAFCRSEEFNQRLAENSRGLFTTNTALLQVPFDVERWTQVASEKYPNGLAKPYTDDLTQWIFHGHPCSSVVWDEDQKWTAEGPLRTDDTVLQVAVARLLGYRWPAELDTEMELAEEQREWVNRCEALLPFADEDGIVCVPPVRGEASAADRLLNLLAAAYGDAWSTDVLAELLKSASHAGKTLETWLRDKFFTQHCKLFQNRPFIWHIWDGLPDGFSALVNYHQLDRKNLETLIYTYLGDWIGRQKQDKNNGIDGAEERLAAAETLKKKLEQILEGEDPYDIFVRWKPIEQQPIGWEPDLNDGVRLNIRPFMTVADVKKKGAGILRDKPNIKWTKDRGKDVESAPWYHLFKGERINDHHLTLAEKRAAREKV